MRLKKKVKNFLTVLFILVSGTMIGYFVYKSTETKSIKEAKIISKIDDYGYNLKENKSDKYKSMFKELKALLKESEVDEDSYVKKITEMFIYDFYTLSDKSSKTDVGGVDFVYPEILENFLMNAQDTYYKYVESNVYNNRNQSLPTISDITIASADKKGFKYLDKVDENAYVVNVSWKYTSDEFSSYQNEATLVFIHDNKKLCLVELD